MSGIIKTTRSFLGDCVSVAHPLFPGLSTSAIFSKCRKYRYVLTREWDPALNAMIFVMLNPSTADELNNDPTVERCYRRARATERIGCLIVLNAFALRSTDPKILKTDPDPIGNPQCDDWIECCIQAYTRPIVVCGWGEHIKVRPGRARQLYDLIVRAGGRPYALAVNKSGQPKHPLYCGYDNEPVHYKGPLK